MTNVKGPVVHHSLQSMILCIHDWRSLSASESHGTPGHCEPMRGLHPWTDSFSTSEKDRNRMTLTSVEQQQSKTMMPINQVHVKKE